MWLLSCSDPAPLQNRKVWLRPGSAHLLGRHSNKLETGERVRYIDHNSVSRKHLLLTVAEVEPGSSARVYDRSLITVEDSSKSGTTLDGEKLRKGAKKLNDKSKYVIKLGSFPGIFTLQWRPVVLTFTTVGKAARAKGSALQEEKEKLEQNDIKLTLEYLTHETTHVVSKKRNTPPNLQALLQARWLVTHSYIDVLVNVCKRRGGDGPGNPGFSPLEDNFEEHWPKELEYLVPTGGEPVPRPNQYFKPDPSRAEVFANYSFISMSRAQYESLLPVINAGSGKMILHEYVEGQTTVDDVVDFIKSVAGKKGAKRFLLSQDSGPGGIVVLRLPEREREKKADIMRPISLALDQRTIEQNEFLDAILTKDCTNFRKPLRSPDSQSLSDDEEIGDVPHASSSIPRPPSDSSSMPQQRSGSKIREPVPMSQRPPRSAQESAPPQQSERQSPDQTSTRRPNRRIITKTAINFDDDFDPSQAVPDDSDDGNETSNSGPSQAHNVQSMDVDQPFQQLSNTQGASRKRPAPVSPEEDKQNEYDRMHPGQLNAKRLKMKAQARGDDLFSQSPKPEAPNPPKEEGKGKGKEKDDGKKSRKKASAPEMEMMAKLKAHRKEEEEKARREREGGQPETAEGMTELVQRIEKHNIEYIDVPSLPPPRPDARSSREDHPEWNGRTNFKKFRSNKDSRGQRARTLNSPRVIISLVEIPKKGHGVGDEYWLETGRDNPRKKSQSQSQSQSQNQHRQSGSALAIANGTVQVDAEEEDDGQAFRRRLQRSREEDAEAEAAAAAFDDTPGSSQTIWSDTQKNATGKRPAAQAGLSSAPPAKKTRQTTGASRRQAVELDGSDDDDPMAFRRRGR